MYSCLRTQNRGSFVWPSMKRSSTCHRSYAIALAPFVLFGILCCTASTETANAAEVLYVAINKADAGVLVALDGLRRGLTNGVHGIGDTSIAHFEIDEGFTCIAAGLTAEGCTVVAGTNKGMVRVYDGLLETNKRAWDANIYGDCAVNRVALGNLGSHLSGLGPAIVVGTTQVRQKSAHVFVLDAHLKLKQTIQLGNESGDVTGLRISDLYKKFTGNELLISSTPLRLMSKTGILASYAFQEEGKAPHNLWTDWSPQNTISEVLVLPDKKSKMQMVILGNKPAREPAHEFGKGIQSFTPDPPSFPKFQWESGLGQEQDNTIVTGAIGDLVGDETPELVVAGNSQIRLLDSQGIQVTSTPVISTKQDVISVAVGDVLDQDGVNEIIVGTSTGLLMVYERVDQEATGYGFLIDDQHGAVYSLGGGTITGLATCQIRRSAIYGNAKNGILAVLCIVVTYAVVFRKALRRYVRAVANKIRMDFGLETPSE